MILGAGTLTTPRSWRKIEPVVVDGVVPDGKVPVKTPLSGLPIASVIAGNAAMA